MLAENAQSWISEWLAEDHAESEIERELKEQIRAFIKLAEDDIDQQKSTRKITPFRSQQFLALLMEWLTEPEQISIRRAFRDWIEYTVSAKKHTDYKITKNPSNLSEVNTMLAENVQSWIYEWIAEEMAAGETKGRLDEGEVLAIVKMAEEGDIDPQKARKKIASFLFQLQNDSFQAEIDERLEKL